jgi:hypothetical protein
MALQGTLDTFELPDVLRLLASTRKSGRLNLRSDRGDGDVWLDEGQVVGVAAPGHGQLPVEEGLFELLRAREGDFVFEPGDEAPTPAPAVDVEPLLAVVEEQLAAWREIEAVVPSLAAWLSLTSTLPTPTVTIDAETWRLVAAIGSGLTVGELGDHLGLGEVPVSSLVRDLVAIGLAEVGPAPVPATIVEPVGAVEAVVPEPASEPVAYETFDQFEPFVPADPPSKAPLFAVEPEPVDVVPVPAEDDLVARQLAMLSPRAAQAVAAAAGDEPEPTAGVADDDAVDRSALLKFLSSVK